MYEGLARVITFVTWRYVALRTFTLHRDAPFSFSVLPLVAAAVERKRNSPRREENCSGTAEKSRQRDGMRSRRKDEKEKNGGNERIFCFAAIFRNFYDYRFSGTGDSPQLG